MFDKLICDFVNYINVDHCKKKTVTYDDIIITFIYLFFVIFSFISLIFLIGISFDIILNEIFRVDNDIVCLEMSIITTCIIFYINSNLDKEISCYK